MQQCPSDLSTLVRKEIELAKAEVREEGTRAARGGGLLGGAGLSGYFTLLFASVALMYLIDQAIPLGWAAFVVAVMYALVGAVLYTTGRREWKKVSPTPQRTAETVKEDVRWAESRTR